jgi:predicted nucleic acid-binding protein
VIVADTSGLLALFNRREPAHAEVSRVIVSEPDLLVVSPYVVAELDYLVATRFGVTAELAVLAELTGGAYELAALGAADVDRCAEVIERYRDQAIGVADASLVVLADEYGTKRLLTLDHRHFDVVRPIGGGRFTIVPE